MQALTRRLRILEYMSTTAELVPVPEGRQAIELGLSGPGGSEAVISAATQAPGAENGGRYAPAPVTSRTCTRPDG